MPILGVSHEWSLTSTCLGSQHLKIIVTGCAGFTTHHLSFSPVKLGAVLVKKTALSHLRAPAGYLTMAWHVESSSHT